MKPYIVIDTETAPAANFSRARMGETSLVYDCGWIVTDGEQMFERRSFVVAETFSNPDLMKSAYYASKLVQYHLGLGIDWTPASFLNIVNQFAADCRKYDVKDVWAYNARFDLATLNNTISTYSNGYRTHFFPFGITVKDIWTAAGDTICNTRKFANYCLSNGFLTAGCNPQTTAEIVYRYLTDNAHFEEAHTALADCDIENYILFRVRKRKQKHNTKPNGSGWRKAAKQLDALAADLQAKAG
jgi:hypothetical protein